jgi:hypothetical protein
MRELKRRESMFEPLAPKTRSPIHMHDRDNPDMLGRLEKNDGEWKIETEMPACWRIKFAISLRVIANFAKKSFHFAIKSDAQLR